MRYAGVVQRIGHRSSKPLISVRFAVPVLNIGINTKNEGDVKMPVFYILIFVGACVLWLLLSFVFRPLGRFGHRLWKDAKDAMSKENND